MKTLKQPVNKITKRLAFLSLPVILLLGAQSAKAILNINLFDDGLDFKIVVSGSLSQFGSPDAGNRCNLNGAFSAPDTLCAGTDALPPTCNISGPTGFGGTGAIYPANSATGPFFGFMSALYVIDPAYTAGQPFLSSATFNNTSLAVFDLTTPGLVGTWSINGTSESINLFIGPPPTPPTVVPGPLPLFGAGAAFGWSRRLRRRISAPVTTSPQA